MLKFRGSENQRIIDVPETIKNGSIVILDEVTSNLDLQFEKNVMEANKVILKNKISFVPLLDKCLSAIITK